MPIKVFGHKNPDTDSTASPIVYAWYLNQIGHTAEAILFGDINKEAQYLLDKFGFTKPNIIKELDANDKVFIVDTNNADELPDSIVNVEIIGIIDHHKLFGNLSTDKPIEIIIKPLACTATLIYQKIKTDSPNLIIDDKNLGLLLGAIISDTLKFTSPTTTQADIDVANEIAKSINIEIDQLASEMFEAKSDLTGMSVSDIINVDSKEFTFGDKKLRIAVLETTKPANALQLKEQLIDEMLSQKQSAGLDYYLFYVVDIIKSESVVILASQSEQQLVANAHQIEVVSDTAILPGIVSRKKQIAPVIEKALS
jgi:manganese-dependent inorganic pyrophosphatase